MCRTFVRWSWVWDVSAMYFHLGDLSRPLARKPSYAFNDLGI